MPCPSGNREKILQCAKELFYRAGYEATSVDDILRRCGVAKSNFYYHFQSKEQLGLAVLDDRIAEFETSVMAALHDRVRGPAARLRAFLDNVVEAHKELEQLGGCPFGNLAAALPTAAEPEREQETARHERFRKRLSQLFRRMESALSACLVEGLERGEFRMETPPSEMATFLVGALQGLHILSKTHCDRTPLTQGITIIRTLLSADS
jgi:TetR/AcrR family transcriptional repressor of nem operon